MSEEKTPIQKAREALEERHAQLTMRFHTLDSSIDGAAATLTKMREESETVEQEMGRLCVAIDTLKELEDD